MRSTPQLAYSVWPTAWGAMGAVGGAAGIVRVVLPHYAPDDLRALLAFEHPGAVASPDAFAELAARCEAYFNGQAVAFDDIACQLPAETSFSGQVLRACRAIPYGQTRSYSRLAQEMGKPDSARAVATALGKNPLPLVIPCHRVLYAGGKLGGFSAAGGVEQKRRLLVLEKAI